MDKFDDGFIIIVTFVNNNNINISNIFGCQSVEIEAGGGGGDCAIINNVVKENCIIIHDGQLQ